MKVTTRNGQILEKMLKKMAFRCTVNIGKGVHSALLESRGTQVETTMKHRYDHQK